MMRSLIPTILAVLALTCPLSAQLSLPGPQVGIPPVGGVVGEVTDRIDDTLEATERQVRQQAQRLLRQRDRTLSRLLRRNGDVIERDVHGDLARRGVLLVQGMDNEARFELVEAGFTVISREEIEGLGFAIHRLAPPEGAELADAQALAERLAPDAEISADNLHFQAGTQQPNSAAALPLALQSLTPIRTEVGVIDGAPGSAVRVLGEKGFATGAPMPSDHGSAVASLLSRAGVSRVRIADVYGSDPAGGNALAIAKALGWLTASGIRVVTISLVGPRNRLVERSIAAARSKGVIVVAAVGNDGPAAPPAYPASYDGVVSVTGVDGRNRALIEAGRTLDLDYAAPGADVYALDKQGRARKWRGTSFATPLAAARLAAALERGGNWRSRLDSEARDLGRSGPDEIFGRGLLCEGCAQKK